MKDRIDGLGPRPDRVNAFTGALLDDEVDDELQRIVESAAAELAVPIALVSLVLERVQFFRAHCGLPPDLAAARATDRDVSFCQFVVRDAKPFEVSSASTDPRVPQDLVERYGIRAYLGVPVTANSQIVGSLCVIDTEERGFSDADVARLVALSRLVDRRLAELAARRSGAAARAEGLKPVFGELRNLLAVLGGACASARVLIAEVAPLARLADLADEVPAYGALASAHEAVADLREVVGEIAGSIDRFVPQVASLERAVLEPHRRVSLAEVVEVSLELARHNTKLCGGASAGPVPAGVYLAAARPSVLAIVSTAMSAVADGLNHAGAGRLDVRASATDEGARLELGSALAEADSASIAARVEELARYEEHVEVATADGAVVLDLAVVPR